MICPLCHGKFKSPGQKKGGEISKRTLTTKDAQTMAYAKKLKKAIKLCNCGKRDIAAGIFHDLSCPYRKFINSMEKPEPIKPGPKSGTRS